MTRERTDLTSEEQIRRAATAQLQLRLPRDWNLAVREQDMSQRGRADAVILLAPPSGRTVTLFAETKRSLVTKELSAMANQLAQYTEAAHAEDPSRQVFPLVIARYLSQPQQQWLEERGIAYADATGNLRIALSEPALFLRDVGATKDPWRGPGRPKGNLKGRSAARIVRALVDYRPPYSVPMLMKLAGTPSGNTYRAVDFIQDQGLLVREAGEIRQVLWRPLLERWAKDYSFSMLVGTNTYLAPRGLLDLVKRLASLDTDDEHDRYALTGSLAAPQWAAYAPARSAMIYADDPERLAARLDLRSVDAGTNVIIARGAETAAFDRTQRLTDMVIVAPSQAAVDLLTAPGRGPEEGRALLDWMEKDESAWRQ